MIEYTRKLPLTFKLLMLYNHYRQPHSDNDKIFRRWWNHLILSTNNKINKLDFFCCNFNSRIINLMILINFVICFPHFCKALLFGIWNYNSNIFLCFDQHILKFFWFDIEIINCIFCTLTITKAWFFWQPQKTIQNHKTPKSL